MLFALAVLQRETLLCSLQCSRWVQGANPLLKNAALDETDGQSVVQRGIDFPPPPPEKKQGLRTRPEALVSGPFLIRSCLRLSARPPAKGDRARYLRVNLTHRNPMNTHAGDCPHEAGRRLPPLGKTDSQSSRCPREYYSGTTSGAVMATTATTATAAAATRSAVGTAEGPPVPKPVSADQPDQLPWLSWYLTCQ